MNRNNQLTLAISEAFVMYYDNILKKWTASGTTKSVIITKVQLLQNTISNQFRIFSCNPLNKEVLINSILYHNLRYQKAHATFHEWRDIDSQIVFGLHFVDSKDAAIFGNAVSMVLKSLELISEQFQELQIKIKDSSNTGQYTMSLVTCNPASPEQSDKSKMIKHYTMISPLRSAMNNENLYHFNKVYRSKSSPTDIKENRSTRIYTTSNHVLNNREMQCLSPHNYENINNIFRKKSEIEDPEISQKCKSLSDDTACGLKRQSPPIRSNYTTISSPRDQYDTLPAFAVISDDLDKRTTELRATNQSNNEHSMGSMIQTESMSQSFASQLQNAINLRKMKQSAITHDELTNLNLSKCTSKYDDGSTEIDRVSEDVVKPCQSKSNSKSNITSKLPIITDLMTEMKLKLERRKQLLNGHTDPNYSSSTDKSDASSTNTSDTGSFIANIDESLDHKLSPNRCASNVDGLHCKNRLTKLSDYRTLCENEEGSNGLADDFIAKQKSINDAHRGSKSPTANVSISDLSRLKKEITDDLRKGFVESKKEILDAIRLLKKVH